MERRSNVNRHHLGWEKRHWQKNNVLRRLRDHQGMIIPMNLYDHRELHHNLLPPPMPTPGQAEELLSHLGHYDSMSERIDYLDMAAAFMQDRNPRYAGHLLVQRSYVLLDPFTQVERDIVAFERDRLAS
ncbi:MAG: hypothetical protein QFB87_04445 [Patescibacteria group bacterium]|nr:hypothetical protein [Patescibacteria group bacterium]